MKKLLITLIGLFFISALTFAQNKDDFKTDNIKYTYCEIVGTQKMFKVMVKIDYGQQRKDTGKAIAFNSMIDALNHMSEKGWEFVQAYSVITQTQYVYHFLLRKEVK